MLEYNILIYSKNKLSIQRLLNFLKKKLKNFNLEIISKYKKKRKKRKKITVLKSTHVNKSAQEHFEYKVYCYTIASQPLKTKKYSLFFKKLKNNIFSDVKTKITIYVGKKNFKLKRKCFKLNSYKLNLCKIKKLQKFSSKKINLPRFNTRPKLYLKFTKKTVNYIKILDYSGELNWDKEKNTS